jgi:alpha-N-arabinofuranosidase
MGQIQRNSADSVAISRRKMLQLAAITTAGLAGRASFAADPEAPVLNIDPKPLHELSAWLYMQFMEPLGVTDGSIEASWDHMKNRWRPDLIEATKELAPPMMRWGGLFSAYYRWREGIGPRERRRPMHNLVWGGVETNQVGTAEFVDFCRQVKADALMCVNFESEGDPQWARNALGEARAGNAQEAAEWVDYCNNPGNAERIGHGYREPLPIKVWQLGNETSFGRGRFQRDSAIAKTIEFSRAMRKADPSIKLIAWGDSGWAPAMIERAGEHIDYLAFHHLFDPGRPLSDDEFRNDLAATWAALMETVKRQEKKIKEIRQQAEGRNVPLAMTECHFTMRGRNRCDLNSTWAVGVAYARFMNLHQRHGDLLKIANIGDFCGTRWQTNVIMLPVPGGKAYVMPAGKVAALYRNHSGREFVSVSGGPSDLDVVASRTGDTFYLHVVNTNRTRSQQVRLAVGGLPLRSLKAFQIAAEPAAEIMSAEKDPMKVKEVILGIDTPVSFPAASVTALELNS